MNIGWIETSKKKYGGIVYNEEARNALAKNFDVDLIICESKYFKKIRYLKFSESLFYLFKLKKEKDLWIRSFFDTVILAFKKSEGKNLVMVHHIDFFAFPLFSRPFLFLLEQIFYHNLKKVDTIVVVSDFWKNYFLKKGYPNVCKIYLGFDLTDFAINNEEVLEFKRNFNFKEKPIIYIGNCQKAKGVVGAYNALKDLDAYLVTSGEPRVKIPAINLNLEYKDYLKLLSASSVVITMSKFKEGWCRTAHEAMLLRTPVIGSGSGGMKELLEGGKQVICQDFSLLKEKVEHMLNHSGKRKKMTEDGYNYAKEFTLEKFDKAWLNLIKNI